MWIVEAFQWFGRRIGILNDKSLTDSSSGDPDKEPYERIQLRKALDDAWKAYQDASKLQIEASDRCMELKKQTVEVCELIGRNVQNLMACSNADREIDRQYQELLDENPEEIDVEEHQEELERNRHLSEQLEALTRSEIARLKQLNDSFKWDEKREANKIWKELEKDVELKRCEYQECENRLEAYKASQG